MRQRRHGSEGPVSGGRPRSASAGWRLKYETSLPTDFQSAQRRVTLQSGLFTTSEEDLTVWRATTAPLVLRRVHRNTARNVAAAQCSAISRDRFLLRFLKVLVFFLSVCHAFVTGSSLKRRTPSVSDPR